MSSQQHNSYNRTLRRIVAFCFVLLLSAIGKGQNSTITIDTIHCNAKGVYTVEKGSLDKDAEKHGAWIKKFGDQVIEESFWKNGVLRSVTNYGGERVTTIEFSTSGEIMKLIEKRNDHVVLLEKCSFPRARRSRIKAYYPNGELKSSGKEKTYKRVLGCLGWRDYKGRHGKWRYYDQKGKRIKTVHYQKGEIVRVNQHND